MGTEGVGIAKPSGGMLALPAPGERGRRAARLHPASMSMALLLSLSFSDGACDEVTLTCQSLCKGLVPSSAERNNEQVVMPRRHMVQTPSLIMRLDSALSNLG